MFVSLLPIPYNMINIIYQWLHCILGIQLFILDIHSIQSGEMIDERY
jgi:hypothetical protein